MKVIVGTTACLFALLLCQGCTQKDESTSGKEASGVKSQAEVLLEKTILDLSNAHTEFPKTKQPQSILRFFTQDYTGIANGKAKTVKDIEKYLSDLLERINLGEPIGISSKIEINKSGVSGTWGWAICDYEYKVGSGGALLQSEKWKCTGIFKKQGDSWLIQHDHCSTDNSYPFLR